MHGDTWQLQEAKARFSEVVRAVKRKKKPQIITVHVKKEVMVVPYQESQDKKLRRNKKKFMTAGELLRNSSVNIKLSSEEIEQLFARDRSMCARERDEPLFD